MRLCANITYKEMTHILSFAMQKGGVGKTTTTISVGGYLSKMGYRVLLIDIDPQANLASGMGIKIDDGKSDNATIYEVLLNPTKGIKYAIKHTDLGIDVIPSTLPLAGAELEVAGKVGREMLLRKA